ncbi:hypothetical protein ACGFZQ_11480 [Streptomyces sp. NPDC048254]|uniref:hypothetical protein n=1 Tax=Streptomyces sp. NPDC048254 TaxID=3365525 RepID=UPI003711B52F
MRKRTAVVVGLCLLAGLLAGCGEETVSVEPSVTTGTQTTGTQTTGTSGRSSCVGHKPVGSPGVDDDSPLQRAAGRVDTLVRKRYSDVYTGFSVDEKHQTADIWRIPSAAFDDEVCGAALKGVTLRLHDTDVNRKTLDALADRISDDMKRWDGTFEMREVGVDERGVVLVGVDDPDKARPILEQAYGERNSPYIKVEHVGEAQALAG